MRRFSAAIFDMGDVFFDATKWRRALTEHLQCLGIAITYPSFCQQWEARLVEVYLGHDNYWAAFHDFITGFRLSEQVVGTILEFARSKAVEVERRTLFDGVAETLADLKTSGLKLAILSDTESREPCVRQRLADLDIEHYFDAVITSIDIGYVKPSRGAFVTTLERIETRAAHAVFVGHDQEELAGAQQCGLTTIAYNDDGAAYADHQIQHFRELLQLLAGRPERAGS